MGALYSWCAELFKYLLDKAKASKRGKMATGMILRPKWRYFRFFKVGKPTIFNHNLISITWALCPVRVLCVCGWDVVRF